MTPSWEALFGNEEVAQKDASVAASLAPASHDAEALVALAYALASDVAQAQLLSDDLAKHFPQDTVVQSVWLPTIRAQIELSRMNATRSIELLQTTAPYELGMLSGSANNSCMYPAYVRAQVYLSAQQGAAAATEFQKILDHRGLLWNCATGPLARLGLARAYALQGDAAKARAAYHDFLTLWKDADPDIPILKQAKAEYAKLQERKNFESARNAVIPNYCKQALSQVTRSGSAENRDTARFDNRHIRSRSEQISPRATANLQRDRFLEIRWETLCVE